MSALGIIFNIVIHKTSTASIKSYQMKWYLFQIWSKPNYVATLMSNGINKFRNVAQPVSRWTVQGILRTKTLQWNFGWSANVSQGPIRHYEVTCTVHACQDGMFIVLSLTVQIFHWLCMYELCHRPWPMEKSLLPQTHTTVTSTKLRCKLWRSTGYKSGIILFRLREC